MASVSDLRLGALGLMALALAGWSGWSQPLPGPGPGMATAARVRAWLPVDWKPSDGMADAAILAQRNTWGWPEGARATGGQAPAPGGASQASPPPVPTGPWRIVATADWGEGLAAVVQTQMPGTQRPLFIFCRPGEALPDGRIVVRVEPDRVEARRAGVTGEKSAIFLFQPRR